MTAWHLIAVSPFEDEAFDQLESSPARMDGAHPPLTDSTVAAPHHTPGRSISPDRPGTHFEMSDLMFTLGIWACYAGLGLTTWLAIT